MPSYCLKCTKKKKSKAESKQKVKAQGLKKTKGIITLFIKWAVCNSKNSSFIKEQEASALLSNLGLKIPLIKILILGDTLF